MSCKAISQKDTQNKTVVRLNEKQARAIATDLIKYDSCKAMLDLQEERINYLSNQVDIYNNQIYIQDSIIAKQNDFIKYQESIMKIKNKIKFHGYIGIKTSELTLLKPALRGNVMAEYGKYSIGGMYEVRQSYNPNWGILLQYRVF